MRYNSREHIENFKEKRIYPRIHDDIFNIVSNEEKGDCNAIDIGASIGLLSERLVKSGVFGGIVAIEGNKKSIETILEVKKLSSAGDKISIEPFFIKNKTLKLLKMIVSDKSVKAVVARRVIPEIAKNEHGIIKDIAKIFYYGGIERIYLQGRVPVKNSTTDFDNVEKEANEFSEYYNIEKSTNSIYILRRK